MKYVIEIIRVYRRAFFGYANEGHWAGEKDKKNLHFSLTTCTVIGAVVVVVGGAGIPSHRIPCLGVLLI